MRFLFVGAGAVGGYFGGRMAEAGCDVTFLVRPKRAAELAESGLVIRSRMGDVTIRDPKTVLADRIAEPFDAVVLSCKAYDLEDAMESFAPAAGPRTAIVPLLNGMRHMDALDARFGKDRVMGGQCQIAATLGAKREIVHLNEAQILGFGERDGSDSDRFQAIAKEMRSAKFTLQASKTILADMWEKWVFLAALAGCTCLMRAPMGDITSAPGGAEFALRMLDECRSVAAAEGVEPRSVFLERVKKMMTEPGSAFTASMLRDIENNFPVEADHILGDLIERGSGLDLPRLRIAYTHLKAYESRRARTMLAASR